MDSQIIKIDIEPKLENLQNGENVKQEEALKLLEEKVGVANLLKNLLEGGYYLGFFPWKFNESKTGFTQRKPWNVQLIACGILQACSVYYMLANLESIPKENHIIRFQYFCLNFVRVLYRLYILKRFWVNGSQYLKPLQLLFKNKYCTFAWTTEGHMYPLMMAYAWYLSSALVPNFLFEFSFVSPATTKCVFLKALSFIALNLGKLADVFLTEFANILLLSCIYTVWFCINSFCKRVNHFKNDASVWPEISREFRSLAELSRMLNMALGKHALLFLLHFLVYFSIYLEDMVSLEYWINKWFYSYFVFGVWLTCRSATVQNKVKLICWEIQTNTAAPLNQTAVFFLETFVRRIGIRTSPNGLNFTVGFVVKYWLIILLAVITAHGSKSGFAASLNWLST